MIKYYAIGLFIILIIILLYILNSNVLENFMDITGAFPNSSSTGWSIFNQTPLGNQQIENCTVGGICKTENGFGIYNKDCNCILGSNSDIITHEEEMNNNNLASSYGIGLSRSVGNTLPYYSVVNEIRDDSSLLCIKNQDFDAYCKNINPKYGVKSIVPCDNTKSIVKCASNVIDGKKYDKKNIITPCLNKSDDFDTWCKYYNNKSIPDGYNANSIGAKNILIGKDGDCYTNNGEPDFNKARAVCDYDHIDTIKKLNPAYSNPQIVPPNNNLNGKTVGYNKFTKCMPINSKKYIFKNNCDDLLNVQNSHAIEIMGYDCNPGYARAKCVKNGDYNPNYFNFNKNLYDSEDEIILSESGDNIIATNSVNKCNC